MKIRIALFYFATLFILWKTPGFAQCDLSSQVEIADFDTTVFSFVVDGAIDNSLVTNGICGVRLRFRHEFIGDINIRLRSPSGQEVHLIGPAIEAAPNTQFVRWDVTIVPCAFTATPDQGLPPVWNNLNSWFQFRTYTGSYFPFNGCLEDFNTGPVNGVWTIIVEDVVEFGAGLIESFTLLFCNPSGFDCSPCLASGGNFVTDTLSVCMGSNALLFTPEIDFESLPPANDYDYRYLVFRNDSLLFTDQNIDLREYAAAEYQICGLSFRSEDQSALSLQEGLPKSQLHSSLIDQLGCFDLSAQCMTLYIVEATDTVTIDTLICRGDILNMNGSTFSEPGVYVVDFTGDSCQTITLLHLKVFEINAIITGNDQLLSCQNTTITLSGLQSSADALITYEWFSESNHERVSLSTESQINVTEPGIYILEINSQNCSQIDSVEVMEDGTLFHVEFEYEMLTCEILSTDVLVHPSKGITSISWTGPNGFTSNEINITANSPGTYQVSITDEDGCITFETIDITSNTFLETPVINPQNITCNNEIVKPNVSLSDTSGLQFMWSSTLGFSSTHLNPNIDKPGFYFLDIMGENGCTRQHLVTIFDDRIFADVSTSAEPINCLFPIRNIQTTSDIQNVNYQWSGPEGFSSVLQNPSVSTGGTYIVSVRTQQGCVTMDTIIIEVDGDRPEITAEDILIRCADNGEVRLRVETNAINPTYEWAGPANYIATGPEPIAQTIGTYSVTVTGSNGCQSASFFDVRPGSNTPNVTIRSNPISCDSSMVRIRPNNLNLSYHYTSPSGIIYMEPSPLVEELGEYIIRVEDSTNGCFARYTHEVVIDTITPELTFGQYEINCSQSSVRLQFGSNINLSTFEWTGPGGFSSDIEYPLVSQTGLYFLRVTGENGCTNQFELEVIDNFDSPTVEVIPLFLTCESGEVLLGFASTDPNLSVEWTGPGGFMSDLINPPVALSGIYTGIVTGDNGCTFDIEVQVMPDTLAPTLTGIESDGVISCSNNIVTLTAFSNDHDVEFIWTDPQQQTIGTGASIQVNKGAEYQVMAILPNGCSTLGFIGVIGDTLPADVQLSFSDIDCDSAQARVEIQSSGDIERITWTGPISIPENTNSFFTNQTGLYSANILGINGCDSLYSFEIQEDTIPPSIDSMIYNPLNCNHPSTDVALITHRSGSQFHWTLPDGTMQTDSVIHTNQSGRYTVSIVGANGCISNSELILEEDFEPPILNTTGGVIDCNMTRIRIGVESDLPVESIQWNGPGDFVSASDHPLVLLPGRYEVRVHAQNGCESIAFADVIDNVIPPSIDLNETTLLFCDGSGVNITLEVSDSQSTYSWFGPEMFFSNDPSPFVDIQGTYVLYLLGSNGCLSIDSTMVILDTLLPEIFAEPKVLTCDQTEATLVAESTRPVHAYQWKNEDFNLGTNSEQTVSEPGLYKVIVTGLNLCIDSIYIDVSEDIISPQINVELQGLIQCDQTNLRIDASASTGSQYLSFLWNTENGLILSPLSSPAIEIEGTGEYHLVIRDSGNGCQSDTTISVAETLQEFENFQLEIIPPSCPGYENGSIRLTGFTGGQPPYLVSLNEGPFRERINLNFLPPGLYTLTVKDGFGCELFEQIIVPEAQGVTVNLGEDRSIRYGESIILNPEFNIGLDGVSVLSWSPPESLSCNDCLSPEASPDRSTEYRLQVTDTNGCTASDEIWIRVELEAVIDIPNVFAPEGNQGNQTFYINHSHGIERINFLSIYDRWGNRVYHHKNFPAGDPDFGWDGNFRGQKSNPSVFVVIAEFLMNDGRVVKVTSDLTLVR
ncbi:MAG TPA: gliding motility-associated C-terminal domain-containing protein [Saprospiraceae bacterium]|nr:gliding motility-associated C-terminal domain-containing protein [Saprospiraceae bacterium]